MTRADTLSREKAIVRILERYDELTDPVRAGFGNGGGGAPFMPHARTCSIMTTHPPRCSCWRRDVDEVTRLLGVMRNRAKQEAYRGTSLGRLRWHVVAFYVDARWITAHERIPTRKGVKLAVPAGQRILRDKTGAWVPSRVVRRPVRHSDAREQRALDGVAWMAERWALEHEPCVPVEEAA